MHLHEVITTEKVPFTYRVAGIGSRFLAWLVDATLLILLGFVGLMVANVLEALRGGVGQTLFSAWLFVLTWGYFLLFEWLWHGQTPGKRLVGIRVIQWRGTGIFFYQSAVRNVLRMVDSLPWLVIFGFYGLGFVVAPWNRFHRRLGDLAAGTLVVHVDQKDRPIQALYEADKQADLPRAAQVRQRLGQLNRQQKQILLDLCIRRDQLSIADRARIFGAVAGFLQNRLDLPLEQHQSPEKFVLAMVGSLASPSAVQ